MLDQVPVNPSLYLVKYDGIDSVHALELYKDKRVLSLKVIAKRVVSSGVTDSSFVDAIVGNISTSISTVHYQRAEPGIRS